MQHELGIVDAPAGWEPPGLAGVSQRLRDSSAQTAYIANNMDIPKNLVLVQADDCWSKHPGLCKEVDAQLFERRLHVAKSLLAVAEEGQWYEVLGRREDALEAACRVCFFACHIRRRSPPILVVALADYVPAHKRCELTYERGLVKFATQGDVARLLVDSAREADEGTALHSIGLRRIRAAMVPDRLDMCVVLSWEDTTMLLSTSGTTAERARKQAATDPQQAYFLGSFLEVCTAHRGTQVAASSTAVPTGHEHAHEVQDGSDGSDTEYEQERIADFLAESLVEVAERSSAGGSRSARSKGVAAAASCEGAPPPEQPPDEAEIAVPPPPPAGRDAPPRRMRLQVTQKFAAPNGHLRWDSRVRSFGVHCAEERHNTGTSKCKFDRAGAKGPIGHMLAWLDKAGGCPSREEHQALKLNADALNLEARSRWREWASTHLPELVELEASERRGDRSEPTGLSGSR